jgi:hypothetical protein
MSNRQNMMYDGYRTYQPASNWSNYLVLENAQLDAGRRKRRQTRGSPLGSSITLHHDNIVDQCRKPLDSESTDAIVIFNMTSCLSKRAKLRADSCPRCREQCEKIEISTCQVRLLTLRSSSTFMNWIFGVGIESFLINHLTTHLAGSRITTSKTLRMIVAVPAEARNIACTPSTIIEYWRSGGNVLTSYKWSYMLAGYYFWLRQKPRVLIIIRVILKIEYLSTRYWMEVTKFRIGYIPHAWTWLWGPVFGWNVRGSIKMTFSAVSTR